MLFFDWRDGYGYINGEIFLFCWMLYGDKDNLFLIIWFLNFDNMFLRCLGRFLNYNLVGFEECYFDLVVFDIVYNSRWLLFELGLEKNRNCLIEYG